MTEEEARDILKAGWGPEREKGLCFGACCANAEEQEALLTLIYGEEPSQ